MQLNLNEMVDSVIRICLTTAVIGLACLILVMAAICVIAWFWDRLSVEADSPEAGRPESTFKPAAAPDKGGAE